MSRFKNIEVIKALCPCAGRLAGCGGKKHLPGIRLRALTTKTTNNLLLHIPNQAINNKNKKQKEILLPVFVAKSLRRRLRKN